MCEGVSIMVTNCTVNGGWTDWSAWSACSQRYSRFPGIFVQSLTLELITFSVVAWPLKRDVERVVIRNQLMVEEFVSALIEPNCIAVIYHRVPFRNNLQSMVDGVSTSTHFTVSQSLYTFIFPPLGPWGSFSECSSECGGGYKIRRRKCDDPEPQNGGMDCAGCHMDYEVCNTQPCNEVKKMGPWTPWMVQVNGSTGDGGQLERRFRFSCKASLPDANGLKIALAKEETRICHSDGSCQRSGDGGDEAGWTDWGSWSPCSAECGGGQQFRTRTCERGNCDGTSKMARACNTHSCKGEI